MAEKIYFFVERIDFLSFFKYNLSIYYFLEGGFMEKIKKNWLKLILWAGAYVNAIIFALCGGYVWLKTDDEDVKKEIKKILFVTLIFIAVNMLVALVHSVLSIAESTNYKAYNVINSLVTIAKIITFAVFALLAFLDNGATDDKEEKDESVSEEEIKEIETDDKNEEVQEEEKPVKKSTRKKKSEE